MDFWMKAGLQLHKAASYVSSLTLHIIKYLRESHHYHQPLRPRISRVLLSRVISSYQVFPWQKLQRLIRALGLPRK